MGVSHSTARSLVVYLPAFRLERCGFDADEVVGLIDEVKNAMRLVALTPMAIAQGLRTGMTATEARALVPSVQLIEARDGEEEIDRTALVRAFEALSDQVSFAWEDALLLSADSVAHLFGGEAGLAEQAVGLAGRFGHRARAVVADDPLMALALGSWSIEDGAIEVIPPKGGAERLARLPIQALRPPEDLVSDLRAIGVLSIGQFAGLDPASVAGRYPSCVALHRVSRGGRASRAPHFVAPVSGAPRVQAPVPGAETIAELQLVMSGLIRDLAEALATEDLAAVRIRMVFQLERKFGKSNLHASTLRVGRPTRSIPTLERLIARRLQRLEFESPIEGLSLEAIETAPDRGWQPGLADRASATEALPDLLARLADQLGAGSLFSAEPVDRWTPESAWEPQPFPRTRFSFTNRVAPREAPLDPVEIQEAFEDVSPLPRPLHLFSEPRRIAVDDSREFVRIESKHQRIERWEGPERLTEAWWDPQASVERDYWVVEFSGQVAWIFQEEGRWFHHGWFD